MEHCILNVEHIYLLTIYLPSQIVMFLLALSRYGEHLKSSFEIPKYHGSIPLCCMTIDDGKKNHNDTR